MFLLKFFSLCSKKYELSDSDIDGCDAIDFHINNFTALSVGDILSCITSSFWPCEITYLKIYMIYFKSLKEPCQPFPAANRFAPA